jgi:hypothetical protein
VSSRNATARQAGALYFVFMIVAIIDQFIFPKMLVSGDAAATASNIVAGEQTYRLGIVLGFATHVIFLFLVVTLYRLFKDVDETPAMLMVVLVSVGVAVALANMLNRFAPLLLLGGAEYLAAFTRPQLEALAMDSIRFRGSGAAVPMAFWGLWLFPFGLLVVKSKFLPRVLGVLLVIAGTAYVIGAFTTIAFPGQRQSLSQFLTPLYFGEVPIIFWLLIRGAKGAPAARSCD